jgi:hypothetical protein
MDRFLTPAAFPRTTKATFFVTVHLRPWSGSGSLAAALAVNFSPIDNRPIEAIVILDAAGILVTASSYETAGDRNYFEILTHEFSHSLGFSVHLFSSWIDSRTDLPYWQFDRS